MIRRRPLNSFEKRQGKLETIITFWISWIIALVASTAIFATVNTFARTVPDYNNVQIEQVQEDWTIDTQIKTINEALRMMWYKTEISYSRYDGNETHIQLEKLMKEHSTNWTTYSFAETNQKWFLFFHTLMFFLLLWWVFWPMMLLAFDSREKRIDKLARKILLTSPSIPEQIWMTFKEMFNILWFTKPEQEQLMKKTTKRKNLSSAELIQEVEKEMKNFKKSK